jgi:hypothetical protein
MVRHQAEQHTCEAATIFQLFPGENQTLLVHRNFLQNTDLILQVVNRPRGESTKVNLDGLPRECFHIYARAAKDEV